ncbi:MarR family winged helix-turn-helix transcriptional regulator [Williamsia sterculiae]|uniref:DNA-binding transcriptional regulator, MarR family n=1 Tax=Williamsia sterculiae TaxID=1344003 RepID=A0A1N7FQM8_9NOCA|nr:MarR family transcriptional regulator [Williamsia sterculiae]SIS02555.1 DNA-binding transcriptional regulator, MarR family [Williamsia sterculiae]
MATDQALTPAELELWHAFKLAGEAVNAGVERDIHMASELTGPEFGVLTRLVDLGGGTLRQMELTQSMRWNKSRLSHQITRMEKRGLVARKATDAVVTVQITDAGRAALRPARPAHALSIRAHLMDKLDAAQRIALAQALSALVERRSDGSTTSG